MRAVIVLWGRGWDVAVVRKSAQCIAFLGPASCLLGASLLQNSYAPLGELSLALLALQIFKPGARLSGDSVCDRLQAMDLSGPV